MKTSAIQRLLSLFSPPVNGGIEPARTSLADFAQLEDRVLYSASPLPAEFVDDPHDPVDFLFNGVNDADVTSPVDDPSADDGFPDQDDTDPQLLLESDPSADSPLEFVVIDSSVPDYQQLIFDLLENKDRTQIEVLVLDDAADGIEQITEQIASLTEIDAIHIVSHGSDGAVKIGNSWLSAANLEAHAGQLASWASSLDSDADLLFYGCNLAATSHGQELMEAVANLTNADVAASDDVTGHQQLAGDWELEYQTGTVESATVFSADLRAAWYATLDTSLWMSTDANVAAPGADGLPGGWTEAQVLDFGGPDLAHGATTDGDLSVVVDFNDFTLDAADAGALHYVSRNITVGGIDGTFDLKAGDVLVSFLQDETILAAYSDSGLDETFDDQDLLVFRPGGFDDYTSGTFFLLLDDVVTDDLKGVTFVEKNTNIGGTDVSAGSFLVIAEASGTASIDLLEPTGVGAGTTTGSLTPLIDLSNLGIDANRLRGIELIEQATTIGGQALADGALLATLNVDDNVTGVADNNLLVDLNDVFVLNLTATGLGTTTGTATMFLDGSDVGLDNNPSQENPYGLALHTASHLVVDTTSDVSDGDISSISALILDRGSDGQISLREAIAATNNTANLDAGTPDQIYFNIGTSDLGYRDPDAIAGTGDEYWVITPASYLGDFTDSVVVDATTQTGCSGQPVIELDGSGATGATAAFNLRTNDSTIRGFAIHSFPDEGIESDGSTGFGDNNIIEDNWVGLTATGAVGGNGEVGILITEDADNNVIRNNVVVSSGGDGIHIRNNADSNWAWGNSVGISSDGTTVRANTGHGVHVSGTATGNIIGTNRDGINDVVERNIISGNLINGVEIDATSSANIIAGNWIGTTGTGSAGVGNSNNGINVQGANNIIGGTSTDDGNVITGSGNEGINLTGTSATGTIIQGNVIGLDPDGATGSGNADVGIAVLAGAHNTTIGGTTTGARNIISNNFEGIEINSNNNIVQGNYIGTDITGSLDRGNRSDDGVEIQNSATGNLIGGTVAGAGNLIAFNARDGINVVTGTGNSVLRNEVHSNVLSGINLGSAGVTANDVGDSDTGANDLQNFPAITLADLNGTNLTVSGTLDTDGPNTQYRVEFFGNTAGTQDATNGEGRYYLGATTITTDGSADGNFSNVVLSGITLGVGDFVTATATRVVDPGQVGIDDQLAYGSTSEFAANLAISVVNDAPQMADWYDNNWLYRKEIVIGASQVSGDLTGFPVLVGLTSDVDLTSFAQADGDDILFTSADGTTKLAHEIEVYTSGTGELTAWVKSDLSAVQDTRLYMYYGNLGATNQEDAANVWDASYQGVWHLNNAPTGAAGEIQDSTLHNNDGTTEGSMDGADLVATKIGTGLDFDEVDDLIRISDSASLDSTAAAATFELWINFDNAADGNHQIVMTSSNRFTTGAKDGYEWASQGDGNHFYYPEGGTDPNYVLGPNPFTNGSWHHLALTQDFATKTVEIYVDGMAMSFTSDTLSTTWTALADPTDWLWGGNPDRATRYFDGMMDEIRVSNVVRSQEWIQTSIKNQDDPGAFFSLGSAETENLHLTDISEDNTNPTGDTVGSVIASVGGNRITDHDVGALEGIAVIGVDDVNGTWQYDSGSGWTDFGTVSDNSAVLVDMAAKIRFVPDANYNGPSGDIAFRAWDQSDGLLSGTDGVDVSTAGGTSAYSIAMHTASLNVLVVNDEQSLDTNMGLTLDEGATATVTALELATSDIDDTPAQVVYEVDTAPTVGTLYRNWVVLTATDTFTQADIDAGLIVYRHDGSETTSDNFGFTVDDGAGMSTSGTFNLSITPVNDAPVNMLAGQPQTIAGSNVDGATDVHAADLDGDGDIDLVSSSWNDDRVTWFQNDGTGSFTEYTIDTGLSGARHVYVEDIDGDTHLDVLVSDYENDTVTWYKNDGTGTPTFSANVVTSAADGAWSSYAVDLDSDGDMDILSASIWDDKVAWYENDGAATPGFTEHVISTNPDGVRTVVAGDLDGDGDIDVASASFVDDTVAWYENDGGAMPSFTEHIVTTNALGAMSVTMDDLDNDGNLDLVAASYADGKIAWFRNDGALLPVFTEQVISTSAAGARDVHTADMDGDGDIDVLSASFVDDKFAWYENDGASLPSFTERLVSQDGDGPRAVTAADLDGDGDIDVVGASLNDDEVGFFENTDGQMGIQTTAEETPLTFNAANNNLVWISDVDAGALEIKVRLEITNGTITLNGTTGLTLDIGTGSADPIVEFRGSVTNINTALDGMTFTPISDFNGVASIHILTDDQGNSGTGGALTDDDTINITVTPINDAPVIATNTGLTVSGGSPGNVITPGQLNEGDVDDAGTDLTYTITAVTTNGTLRLSGAALSLSDTFTQADIDAGNVTYDHDGSPTTTDSFDFSLADGGEDGATAATGTFNITITGNNDEQLLAVNTGATVNEGTTGNTITTLMLQTTDTDHIPTQLVYTITSASSNGTLRLSGTALGVSDTFTQADIDAGNVTYDHHGSETLSDNFAFDVDDGQGAVSSGTFNLTVTPLNDSPVVATNTGMTAAEGSTGNVLTTAMLNEGDPDDAGAGLTYTITSTTGNGTLRLLGTALAVSDTFTQADIDAGNVTYDHDGTETTTDSFDFSLADGGEDGAIPATGTFNFTITSVNDAPAITNNLLTVNEGQTVTIATGDIDAVDPEGNALAFSVTGITGGQFELVSAPGVAVTSFTRAQVAGGQVQFVHDGGETAPTYSVEASDGLLNSGPQVATITFTNVNDDPFNAGSLPASVTVAEDVLSDVDLSAINIQDVDDGGGNLTVTLSTSTGGDLLASSGGGVTVVGSGSGTISLNGTEADLHLFTGNPANIQYQHATDDLSGSNVDTITVRVSDNGNTGLGGGGNIVFGSVSVDIAAMNDAPVNTAPGPAATTEDTSTVFSMGTGNAIQVGDMDAGGSLIRVQLSVDAGGVLSLAGTAGLTFLTGDGSADATMDFAGTVADINAALDGLTFDPAADFNGTANLTVSTDDQGNSGLGGPMTDVDVIPIAVAPVNDAPTAGDDTLTTFANELLNVPYASLLANDADVDGDALNVVLNTLPTRGILVAGGGGSFQYMPLPGFFGNDSFTYWAVDGSGAGDIGTVTIEVSIPPMAPAGGGGSGSVITPVSDSEEELLTVTALISIAPVSADESHSSAAPRRVPMDLQSPESSVLDLLSVSTEFGLGNLVGDRVDFVRLDTLDFSGASTDGAGATAALRLEAAYLQQLNNLAKQFEVQVEFDALSAIALGSAASAATAAYIIWTIRSGYMFAGMVASLPVWMRIDPLPVLDFNEVRKQKSTKQPNGSRNLLQTLLHESPSFSGA